MSLRRKIIALAVVPLLGAALALALVVSRHTVRLGDAQAALIEDTLLKQKRGELERAVELVRNQIEAVSAESPNLAVARARTREILLGARYGTDGYFFANDLTGVYVVHPRQPELVGKSLWDLTDSRGRYIIREMQASALHGDGFVTYPWQKPSTGKRADKLARVAFLPKVGWVFGTGVYLDDVAVATGSVREQARASVAETLWEVAFAVLVALVAVVAGALILNVSAKRVADRRLRALNTELEALNEGVATLLEGERKRVSGELHDGITQVLAGAKYHFEAARQQLGGDEGTAHATLDRGLQRLQQGIADVRRISHELLPSELEELGLPAALQRLTDEVAERSGMAVEFTESLAGATIPALQSLALFRVAQEAMTNVERHAAATSVRVVLRGAGAGREVFLRVEDDGKGFDPGIVSRGSVEGLGLRSIRQRVESLRGRFDVMSRPGHTALDVSLELGPAT
jgi:two-component system NarL family sensor kinase